MREEGIQLQALLEVLSHFQAPDVLEELVVPKHINASLHNLLPMHALQSDVGVVLLEFEVQCLVEVYVRSFNCVHVLSYHRELINIKVLWEYFHYSLLLNYY